MFSHFSVWSYSGWPDIWLCLKTIRLKTTFVFRSVRQCYDWMLRKRISSFSHRDHERGRKTTIKIMWRSQLTVCAAAPDLVLTSLGRNAHPVISVSVSFLTNQSTKISLLLFLSVSLFWVCVFPAGWKRGSLKPLSVSAECDLWDETQVWGSLIMICQVWWILFIYLTMWWRIFIDKASHSDLNSKKNVSIWKVNMMLN